MKIGFADRLAHVAMFCVLGSALLSQSAPASAASKTLTISGKPGSSATVGTSYSFQPTAKDTVKSRIKFDIYNKPAWATFDGTTGRLSGTPTRHDVGTYGNITIRLTDWYGYVTTPAFSITVTNPPPPNTAPTISGRAPTVVNAGAAYSFVPTAADADKNTLTFSIANKPRWATFNTSSGKLYGVPTDADAGVYANVQISVSDGKSQVALPAFSIAVKEATVRNAELSWTPPLANTDGSTLTDLSGYKVYYGTNPDALTQVITVANPGLTTYVIDGLPSGKWYFAMSSVAADGAESQRSSVVSTTIL
jgi:Putative Ig domain